MKTLTNLIATDLKIERESIIDFELCLFDIQPPAICGLHDEFISSPRLDNLASSFASLDAIIEYAKKDQTTRNHAEIDMIILFDHEEIGSCSAQGADSNMAVEITQRVFNSFGKHS